MVYPHVRGRAHGLIHGLIGFGVVALDGDSIRSRLALRAWNSCVIHASQIPDGIVMVCALIGGGAGSSALARQTARTGLPLNFLLVPFCLFLLIARTSLQK